DLERADQPHLAQPGGDAGHLAARVDDRVERRPDGLLDRRLRVHRRSGHATAVATRPPLHGGAYEVVPANSSLPASACICFRSSPRMRAAFSARIFFLISRVSGGTP